jgi:hypothetical protein
LPQAWLIGNHDINYDEVYKTENSEDYVLSADELYAYLTANDINVTMDKDNLSGNYGYIDFNNQRTRVYCLNTSDIYEHYSTDITNGSDAVANCISATQAQWFANTLEELNKKEDSEDWKILLCSHYPLNYVETTKFIIKILENYKLKQDFKVEFPISTLETGEKKEISANFSQGTPATILANVHGHSHNLRTAYISSTGQDTEDAWLLRLCTPCINVGRENECATYADESFAKTYG